MDSSILAPLRETLDKMALQLFLFFGICIVAYCLVFVILRKLKMPKSIANFFATCALLGTGYFSIIYGLIPGFRS